MIYLNNSDFSGFNREGVSSKEPTSRKEEEV